MKQYLFGISKFCENVVESGILNKIDGLFDNNATKIGAIKFGLVIQKPCYFEDTEVVVTISAKYHLEVIRELLELGYNSFSIIHSVSGNYIKKHYNFSHRNYIVDKKCLILLVLEHRSYSGICAIEYMVQNKLLDISNEVTLKRFQNDKNDSDYLYDIAVAKYIITERGNVSVEGSSIKIIQLWHGFPLKSMKNMLMSSTDNLSTVKNWRRFDYIASYGQNYTNFMCACYGTLAKQYFVTGMPRNDLLYVTDGKKNVADIMPDAAGRKIILYMPTFREIECRSYSEIDGDDEGYIFYWNDFAIDHLEKFCQQNEAYFIFKLHPSDASKVKSWYARSQYIGIMTDEMLGEKCMYEYLNAADVLVTDYSSVYFDYLLLDRPIVFTDKDIDTYARKRGFMLEPLEFWRPGTTVHTYDALEKELQKALSGEDVYKQARHDLMPFVHKYQDGDSTQRLFDFIENDMERMKL